MKLAIVIEHFDASRGGAERLAGWVAHEMARRGHEVHVICHDVAARVSRFRQATLRASFDAHRSRRAHGMPGAMGGAAGEMPELLAGAAPAAGPADGARAQQGDMGTKGSGDMGKAGAGRVHVHRLRGMRLHTALGFRLFGRRARALCRRGVGGIGAGGIAGMGGVGGAGFDVVHSFTVAWAGDIYHPQAGVYAAMQAQAVAMRGEGGPAAGRAWKQIWQRLGKQRTLLALEKRALAEAPRVVSSCAMMTGQLAAYYGVGVGGRVVTLATPRVEDGAERGARAAQESAVDRAWFRGHYKLAAGDRVALFVGHDFRRKGLRQAIEAVALTGAWKLVIVGLGRVREYVELAQRLGLMPREGEGGGTAAGDQEMGGGGGGLGPRVLFVGPTRELAAVYAAADALLLPAFYEPSGVVALEALGHGLPVVSSAFLGAAELVAASRAGTIVADPRDAAALAAALAALPAAHSAEGRALAARVRGAAESVTTEGFADRLEELYRQVAGRAG